MRLNFGWWFQERVNGIAWRRVRFGGWWLPVVVRVTP